MRGSDLDRAKAITGAVNYVAAPDKEEFSLFDPKFLEDTAIREGFPPTLAILAERQERIEHFQKEAFYKVSLRFRIFQ